MTPPRPSRSILACAPSPTHRLVVTLVAVGCALAAAPVHAQSLRGSSASMERQHREARTHDFSFLSRRQDVTRLVGAGLLVPLNGGSDYRLKDVSFGVARPEVRLFVERLSAQYTKACGSPLVVTSLTRPTAYQPSNASSRSVHPTGMAVDLRIPEGTACRQWLESTLLALEGRKVLDVTRETSPPHYHVALFPSAYVAYVASVTGRPANRVAAPAKARATPTRSQASHTVGRGDTLWRIAQSYDTTPAAIQRVNRLKTTDIRLGQRLVIPSRGD